MYEQKNQFLFERLCSWTYLYISNTRTNVCIIQNINSGLHSGDTITLKINI